MSENEIVSGQQSAWQLLKKMGEGDAGEVYLVEALSGDQTAILKRPRMSAFTGDMFRQSAQITAEAKILMALSSAPGFDARIRVKTPALLDQSKPGSEYNSRNFIVIEKAPGLDLGFLARVAQMGLAPNEEAISGFTLEDRVLVDAIARFGKIPVRILIAILYRLTHFIDFIHSISIANNGSKTSGILWNDVKPDHLFWDSQRATLTVIDWGNARVLESDLATSDRQFSWLDDYRQLFEEMGRFLSALAPDLQARLAWPAQFSSENINLAAIADLKNRLEAALQEETQGMAEARAGEDLLLRADLGAEISLSDIQAIQDQILEFGETPDFERTLRYTASFAARLTQDDRLDDLRKLCGWASSLPGADADHWKLVDFLARIPGRSEGAQRALFLDAIQNAICHEWDNALWNVATAIREYAEPDWWQDLTGRVRSLSLGPEAGNLRPLVVVRRINFTVQAAAQQMEEQGDPVGKGGTSEATSLERVQLLMRRLNDEVIANWTQLDPSPPDCNLEYKAIEPVLVEAGQLMPERHRSFLTILSHPKAQVKRVLGDWSDKGFLEARKNLRCLLVWDPDRRRVLRADQAILAAPDFLKKVQTGPLAEDSFPEWITSVEFFGRELRNQVGPAGWLDAILENCKQIRKGVWPSDLALSRPESVREMPWLTRFDRKEHVRTLLEGEPQTQPAVDSAELPQIHGVEEDRLGPDAGMILLEPLDAWMPEARGSSARVVSGILQFSERSNFPAAIKLMRMDQVHYALPLFVEEVQILSILHDLPGVSHLIECGFIRLDEGAQFPLVSANAAPPATGRVVRIGPDSPQEFPARINEMIEAGWTPYLAIEQQDQENNLLFLCDAGVTRGQYLPMVTLLQMSIQICDILEVAHRRNIVYRDHKILHFYWQSVDRGIYMIDWNVARYHPDGLTQTEINMDIVQFGARGLHHILTGRTAPGALPLGPTRPEEIEQAALSYKTQWTYDDQRLSAELRSILERVLAGDYLRFTALRDDLKKTMMQLPNTRQMSA